jgi:hypothetical protein
MLSVFVQNVIMARDFINNAFIQNVVMLNVAAPQKRAQEKIRR